MIVTPANAPWAVIPNDILVKKFPSVRLTFLYFSPGGRACEPCEDASFTPDVLASEQALVARIKQETPDGLYLRVSPHTRSEYLVTLLFDACAPSTRKVVEFYDMSVLLDQQSVAYIFAMDQAAIERAAQACQRALDDADALVFKMGGPLFDAWSHAFKSKSILYFPCVDHGLDVNTGDVTKRHYPEMSSGVTRLIYAGAISSRELDGGIGSAPGANFLRYFSAIAADDSLSLDVINAVHVAESEDRSPKFAPLIRYMQAHAIGYRRALVGREFHDYLAGFDMGFCCAHYAGDRVQRVTQYGLPNRMMSYLTADVPVIIDDQFTYAADLIRDFDAGLVVRAGDFEQMLHQIKGFDRVRARHGMARLRTSMIKRNQNALTRLESLWFKG